MVGRREAEQVYPLFVVNSKSNNEGLIMRGMRRVWKLDAGNKSKETVSSGHIGAAVYMNSSGCEIMCKICTVLNLIKSQHGERNWVQSSTTDKELLAIITCRERRTQFSLRKRIYPLILGHTAFAWKAYTPKNIYKAQIGLEGRKTTTTLGEKQKGKWGLIWEALWEERWIWSKHAWNSQLIKTIIIVRTSNVSYVERI